MKLQNFIFLALTLLTANLIEYLPALILAAFTSSESSKQHESLTSISRRTVTRSYLINLKGKIPFYGRLSIYIRLKKGKSKLLQASRNIIAFQSLIPGKKFTIFNSLPMRAAILRPFKINFQTFFH